MRLLIAAGALLMAAPALVLADDPLMPAPLEQALVEGSAGNDAGDWRYTMTIEAGERVLVGRFDGSRPDAERWTLTSPAEADLSDGMRGLWASFTEPDEDEADEAGGLFFNAEGMMPVAGSVAVESDEGGLRRYSFRPDLSGTDEAEFAEYIHGEYAVSGEPARMQSVRLYAPESFKPNIAARIHRFEMEQSYEARVGLPAPVLVRMEQTIAGRAAFQDFDQSLVIRFSDIEFLGE